MTKHPTRTPDEDSKAHMVDYWSQTHSVDTPEAPRLQMFCPRCHKMVWQDKTFRGNECVILCHDCALEHNGWLYKQMVRQQRQAGNWNVPDMA